MTGRPVGQAVKDEIVRLWKAGLRKSEIKRQVGITNHNTVLRVLRQAGLIKSVRVGRPPIGHDTYITRNDKPAAPTVDDVVAAAREKLEHRRLLAQERQLLFDVAGERSLREELCRLIRETTTRLAPPPAFRRPQRLSTKCSRETALLCLSDWHAYEIVKKARTQGFNEYNAEIFARRVRRVIDETIRITDRLEAGGGWCVDNCVVSCNGDFVSGTIQDVEKHTDAPHVIAAAYGCARTLSLAVRDLAARFEKVEVFCTAGNHGRLPDQKRVAAKDPTRNWDTLIYWIARDSLLDCPNVRFYVPDSYVLSFEIGSKRFVQYHGTKIKSWNSIPHYGIERWTRRIQALRSRRHEPADYFLIGHFHSDSSMSASGARTKVNGSLIGGTEHSVEELGASELPSQRLFFVSDPVGINSEWEILGEVEGEDYRDSYPVYPWEVA